MRSRLKATGYGRVMPPRIIPESRWLSIRSLRGGRCRIWGGFGRGPANNAGDADAAARPVRLEPPKGGALFRIVEFPPDSTWRNRGAVAREAFDSIQAGHAPDHSSADPMMHKTNTIDYIVVLKGEIYAIVDKGETLLRPGDVFIQRGTNHSWSVRGNEPCIIAVVLVSANPVGKAPKAPAKKAAAKKAPKRTAKVKRKR